MTHQNQTVEIIMRLPRKQEDVRLAQDNKIISTASLLMNFTKGHRYQVLRVFNPK